MLVGKRDAVPRRQLGGEPERFDGPGIGAARFYVRILHVEPLRRIAGVEVGEGSRYRVNGLVLARVDEEPEPVFLDGTATRAARVPRADHSGWLCQSVADQRVVEVIAGGPFACAAVEGRPPERVAARFRHEVHLGPAAFDL